VQEHRGDILFTHQGLSGSGILDPFQEYQSGRRIEAPFVPEDKRAVLEEWIIIGRDKMEGKAYCLGWQICHIQCLSLPG